MKTWICKPIFHIKENHVIIVKIYKPAYPSKSLDGAECWYAIIACIMYDVSQLYHAF